MTASKRVVVAAPRGYCAGVDRAVITVEKALDLYGAPVYVRKEIVHNRHVVEDLEERGAIFVEELDEVPEGSTVVFSAHGVSPAVKAEANDRGLKSIDATCPLVTKVHHEAKRFAADGKTILLIGHEGHEEVDGTRGHAPEPAEIGLADDADARAYLQGTLILGAHQASLRILHARHDDLRTDDARADLGRPVDRRAPAVQRPQQLEGAFGHANLAKALRHHQREVDVLMPGDRDADVVPEELHQLLIDHAPSHYARGAGLRGRAQRRSRNKRAAD